MIAELFGGQEHRLVAASQVRADFELTTGLRLSVLVDEEDLVVKWTVHQEQTNRQFASGALRLPGPLVT